LYIAAQNGHLAFVQCLVKELGANINQATNTGCTPLYIAAEQEHLSVVQCFVKEYGADVN
jgi:ankyrin repeat protein